MGQLVKRGSRRVKLGEQTRLLALELKLFNAISEGPEGKLPDSRDISGSSTDHTDKSYALVRSDTPNSAKSAGKSDIPTKSSDLR